MTDCLRHERRGRGLRPARESSPAVRVGLLIALASVALVMAGNARADDGALRATLGEQLPRAVAAASAAGLARGGPDEADAAEAEYGAARDLQAAVDRAWPVGSACTAAYVAARAYAAALVEQAEGVDRLSPALTAAGDAAARRAAARLARARGACAASAGPSQPAAPALERPVPHEAYFGAAVAIGGVAPRGAVVAVVGVDRRPGCGGQGARLGSGRFRRTLRLAPGRHLLQVAYCASGRTLVARTLAVPIRMLPGSVSRVAAPGPPDRIVSARLAAVASGFSGYSAVWFHDAATGRTAGWNAETPFPAASTVKLGLLVAVLARFGPRSPLAYDLTAMATWSSNLATNRLLVELGGSEEEGAAIAQDTLHRLGAAASTFTGGYRVATAARDSPGAGPPLVSSRVTTAHDLGRILALVLAGALGERDALRRLELTRDEARLALGLLLDSEPVGDNVGLLRGAFPPGLPIAQKQGWISVARHTAAIVFEPSGPKIVVLLTYRDGLTLEQAQRYAKNVVAALPA